MQWNARNVPTGATKVTFPVLDPDLRPPIQGLFARDRLYTCLCETYLG